MNRIELVKEWILRNIEQKEPALPKEIVQEIRDSQDVMFLLRTQNMVAWSIDIDPFVNMQELLTMGFSMIEIFQANRENMQAIDANE